MGLKNSLEKVGEVVEHIIYSNRDIGYLRAGKADVYTHIGGKASIFLDTDMGPRMVPKLSSSNAAVATIDRDGYVYGHSKGTATVSIECANLSVSATVHVGNEVRDTSSLPAQDRLIDEIAIINPRETLEEGDEYVLYAVGISNNLELKYDFGYYNPIKYISSDPSVAGITFGTLTAFKPGTCVITATDLNGNATASFNLTVTPKYVPTATDAETYVPLIDNTGETDATVSIAEALAYAANNGYKKVSFPKGTYKMNGDNRPNNAAIEIPSNMIVDFNGSNIFITEGTAVLSGYTMFYISGQHNVWFQNANFYGENYDRETWIRVEGTRILIIGGASKNIHVENCAFRFCPGFNVGLAHTWNNVGAFTPENVEAGGLGANGENVEATKTWRMVNYVQVRTVSGGWAVGQYQGFRAQHLRSRIYDICFYDAQYNFLFRKRNCYQFQRYEYPVGVTPKYCKIAFFQDEAPTGYDLDFHSFAMIVDQISPEDVYFKNCIFEKAVSTGLSPQGGIHMVVDGCQFINNGVQDPYSHIDWEDGRQSAQGHIVKNCNFIQKDWGGVNNCQLINVYSRNITFHDNYFYQGTFRVGADSTMARTYNNIFEDVPTITVGGKCDSIFAGNICNTTPTIVQESMGNTHTISVDNEIIT